MKVLRGLIIMGIFSFVSKASGAKNMELVIGAKAPQVVSVDHDGKKVDLGAEAKEGYTLVYFYPKADTPGCTAQACSLRDHFADLTSKGVKVFGVSTDSPADQKKFKEKYRLPFSLIADEKKEVLKAFGVSSTMGFASRQAFLMKDAKVVWLDHSASTKQQAEDVLKFLESSK